MMNESRYIVQGSVEPVLVAAAAAEDVTTDKWTGSIGSAVRRKLSIPASIATFSAVPVSTSPEDVSYDRWRGGGERVVRRLIPGNGSSVIDTQQLASAETAQIDKWIGDAGKVVRRTIPGKFQYAIDASQLNQTEYAQIDKWLGDLGRIVRPLKPGRANAEIDTRQLTQSEFITQDKWAGELGRVVRPKLSGHYAFDTDAKALLDAEYAQIDKWLGHNGRIVLPLKKGKFYFDIDASQLSQAENSSIDRWIGDAGRVVRNRIRGKSEYNLIELVEAVSETVTSDKWTPPRDLFHREYRYRIRPRDVIDTTQLTQAEFSSLDRWISSTGRRLPLPLQPIREYFTRDYTFGQFESITLDKWIESVGLGKTARQPIRPRFDIDSSLLVQPEYAQIDKRLGDLGRIVRPLKSGKFDAVIDASQLAQAEFTSIDRWISSTAIGKAARQPIRPRFDIDATALIQQETLYLDRWIGDLGRIVIPKTAGSARIDLIELVTADIVIPSLQAWIEFPRRRKTPGRFEYAIDTNAVTQTESISIDKWRRDDAVTPWRSIGKPHPKRPWYAYDTKLHVSPTTLHLGDMGDTSADPVVSKKTTKASVKDKTTVPVYYRRGTRKA